MADAEVGAGAFLSESLVYADGADGRDDAESQSYSKRRQVWECCSKSSRLTSLYGPPQASPISANSTPVKLAAEGADTRRKRAACWSPRICLPGSLARIHSAHKPLLGERQCAGRCAAHEAKRNDGALIFRINALALRAEIPASVNSVASVVQDPETLRCPAQVHR